VIVLGKFLGKIILGKIILGKFLEIKEEILKSFNAFVITLHV